MRNAALLFVALGWLCADASAESAAISDDVDANVREIRGSNDALRDDVFAKMGGSSVESRAFLHCLASPYVDLAGRPELQETIDFFDTGRRNAFTRQSRAAGVSWNLRYALGGRPANFRQEIDASDAQWALVLFGANDAQNQNERIYARRLVYLVEELAALGVVPVLGSASPRRSKTKDRWIQRFNAITQAVALHWNLPYIDYYAAMKALPRKGLARDGVHPNVLGQGGVRSACQFTEKGLRYGNNVRNLVTLEMLDTLRRIAERDLTPDSTTADITLTGTQDAALEDAGTGAGTDTDTDTGTGTGTVGWRPRGRCLTVCAMSLSNDELLALDRKYLWRPYTSSEDHESRPLFIVDHADGPWLTSPSGERVLDASGSWWCNNLGHRHPRLRRALAAQAERLMHCTFGGATHEPGVRLAAELAAVAPAGLSRVFFSDNGSTSVEVALKIAFQYWQQNGRENRTRFLTLPGGYHGDTIGAMSVGAVDAFSGVFRPLMFEAIRPVDAVDHEWGPVFDDLVKRLERDGDLIAGVIVEPIVQGAAGMRMYPPALLTRLREAVDRADTFLIADEVFTGFGRTGSMWACDHAGISPDLLCTAKGLTGGVLPLSATLATDRIYDGFRGGKDRALMHGHTFFANPLGAALALEVLAIYRDERILVEAVPKAQRLARAIEAMVSIPGVRHPRARGMCAAFDVGELGYMGSVGWAISEAALSLGAHLRPLGNTIYVVPPLNIDSADLDQLLRVVRQATEQVLVKTS
ncbi:MAG: adenosylmethionine--8-amino-7-oxononanoate transaminase [Polyangiales bacterium]